MPQNSQGNPQPGVASLVGGILEDGQKLVRQEIALAQHEVAGAWDKAKTGGAFLSSALVVFAVGGVLLGFMLVKLLHQYLLPNHEWACFGIGGGRVRAPRRCLAVRRRQPDQQSPRVAPPDGRNAYRGRAVAQ